MARAVCAFTFFCTFLLAHRSLTLYFCVHAYLSLSVLSGLAAQLSSECSAGVSGSVLQLLYVLQSVACYAAAKLQPLVALLQWRDELATLALIVFLAQVALVALLMPVRILLLLLTLALALHRTRIFATALEVQATVLRYCKRRMYARDAFPPSNIALTIMAQQQRK